MVKQITVTSKRNIGLQSLKDYLTSTEKKILVQMLNSDMDKGQVRNKVFQIFKTESNTANIVINTIVKSVILERNESVVQKVSIKYC